MTKQYPVFITIFVITLLADSIVMLLFNQIIVELYRYQFVLYCTIFVSVYNLVNYLIFIINFDILDLVIENYLISIIILFVVLLISPVIVLTLPFTMILGYIVMLCINFTISIQIINKNFNRDKSIPEIITQISGYINKSK